MAARASGHTAHFVGWHMSSAEALQYQALWLEEQGVITAPMHTAPTARGQKPSEERL